MTARKLKPWSRGPMRDVVDVGPAAAGSAFKYILLLKCGHEVGKHVLRGKQDECGMAPMRTRCGTCKLEREAS